LVKPDIAARQIEADARAAVTVTVAPEGGTSVVPPASPDGVTPPQPKPGGQKIMRRFHGTVLVDPTRLGRDAGKVAEEVVQHMAGLVGAKVEVTIEISAEIPNGAPENMVRTVTENCRTLKFKSYGFEEE
jgi:hypothetical protein